MSNYIQDMMARVAAMQLEAIGSGSTYATIDPPLRNAVPYWPYQQEQMPYMLNRLGATTMDAGGYSEDIRDVTHNILMRLVVDHVTAKYEGEVSDYAYQYIQPLQQYFREHPMLTTDGGSYTAHPDYLFYETRIVSHTGLVVFRNFGGLPPQLSIEFTLEVPYLREGDPA